MKQLLETIQSVHQLLQQVKADALNPDLLRSVENELGNIHIQEVINDTMKELPQPSAEKDQSEDTDNRQSNQLADQLNKATSPINTALTQIKQLRDTLNLPALDPIIQQAQKILRPLYNFTASLNNIR